MRGSRLLWRLYAGYAVIILGTAVFLGLVVERHVTEKQEALLHRTLRSSAVLLAELACPALTGHATVPDSLLQYQVSRLGVRERMRFTVIAADGRVLADSRKDPATMSNHGKRPEILEALAREYGTATRYSETIAEMLVYEAVRIDAGGQNVGFARAALSRRAVRDAAAEVRGIALAAIAAGVFIALLVGWSFARSVTRPIVEITRAARRIAGGGEAPTIRVHRPDEIGDLARAFTTMTDQLRRHIDTITADRNKTGAILAGMVEGVIAVDRDENVVHANAAARSILGFVSDAAPGRRIWEVTRVAEASDVVRAAMRDDRVCIAEARIAGPGPEQIVQLTATPLKSATGELDGSILVLHDVSELRRLESVRRDFIGNISHEIKTPLTAIRGLVETLIDDDDMDAETHRRFLGKVQEQSQRLSNLVVDLLTISRLESDTGTGQMEPVDLRTPLVDSYRALSAAAESRGIRVEAQVPDDAVRILGDAEALRELVDNLLGNAIKYTPRGGDVSADLHVEGSAAVLEVRDTGIGIPVEHQGRIFERFYRVDKARSREMGGTGLGLSIVKHVALAHEGSVSVRSAAGRGSTFRVELPLVRNARYGAAPRATESDPEKPTA